MEHLMGLLKVRVLRGINLAVRDFRSSDPYCILRMGKLRFLGVLKKGFASGSVMDPECGMPSSLDDVMGLLKVRVVKGVNLTACDVSTSDPHVVLSLGEQKLKTHVRKKNVNPEWNEELTLSVAEPIMPLKVQVFDKDTFTQDDSMGDAELDIVPFIEAVKMNLEGVQDGTLLNKIQPNRQNCLAEESRIVLLDGRVTQYVCLRLRNVECGEVELQLQWVYLPGKRFSK